MKLSKAKAQLALFSNTLIWGGTFTIIKKALDGISPMAFVSSRFLLASLVMLPFFGGALLRANKRQYIQATNLGILLYIGFITQTIGLLTTTATKSAFITGTFVVFTPLLQTIMERRRPSAANILAIVLAGFGIIFLSSKGSSLFGILQELHDNFSFGDFLTLICAVSYAMYIVYLDMISDNVEFRFLTYWQILVTAILSCISIPLLHFTGFEPTRFTLSPTVIGAILYTALFATVLTTAMQTRFQKAVSPTRASLIFSMEPIFAAIFAFFILGETISSFGFLGSACILAAIILSEFFSND
jgi:drug/metabolite transporter (DMT)-like permease